MYQLSWGIAKARALPQIYLSSQPYQWANVVRYADTQSRFMSIDGIVTSCQVVGCDFYNPTPWHAMPADEFTSANLLSPLQAWTGIHELLPNHHVPFVTDFVNAVY